MGQSIEPCVKYINYKNIKMLTNLGNVMARFQGSQSLFASFIVSTQNRENALIVTTRTKKSFGVS